jgi:hypothetical protein
MKMKKVIFFYFSSLMEHRWNEIDRGKPKYSEKTYPSATLSTTNPTWTDWGSNPDLRDERPASNRLSQPNCMFVSISTATIFGQFNAFCFVVDHI